MLTLQIPAREKYLPATHEFLQLPADSMVLEHSLKSIAKWESKTHRSFFDNAQMTTADFTEYVRCMTIKPPKYDESYERIDVQGVAEITAYMNDPMSAKKFYERKKKKARVHDSVTVENMYLLMIEYGVPFDPCENWHFGRLMALIKTCERNNAGGEKMSYQERQQWYNELNDARRKRLGTKG